MKNILLALGLSLFPILANADQAIGKVTNLGCHNVDDTCYVSLDGYPTSSYCNKSGNIRWLASSSFGQRWYATLLAAQISGATVSLYVDGTCSSQGYPTFIYGSVNAP